MRKLLTLVSATLITGSLFAGGLVTNTNQSASWVRLPARNASIETDAVYYNPAGLMKLENGFHLSLSNQTIFQTREIDNSYYSLNESLYKGKVFAPFFPSIYAAYKVDRLAFSVGFMPVGGGGGATYDKGLPSFEMGISDLVAGLASQGVTGYSTDIYFKGSSTFLGYQGTVSLKINDFISVAAGARYVTAKNVYTGHLKNVQVLMGGNYVPAVTVLDGIVSNLTGIIGIPGNLAGAIGAGFGGATLADLVGAGQMTADQKTAIETGLLYVGVPAAALPTMDLNTISGTVTAATPTLQTTRAKTAATSTLVSDKTADVTQSGSGITPIISVNLSPTENLNIAIKFELPTKIELENNTTQDLLIGYTSTGEPITEFPDGEKTRNDMPAMLALGVEYRLSPDFKVALGGDYYFDKSADYGHKVDADLNPRTPATHIDNSDIIENNGMSIAGGLEFKISDKLLVSGGYVYANKGVNSKYQSDMTFGNATHTFGAGGALAVTDNFKINLGASYTAYVKDTKTIDHIVEVAGTPINISADETYKKSTFVLGLGLDFSF
jgi:long-subunit fatty acid transport protein